MNKMPRNPTLDYYTAPRRLELHAPAWGSRKHNAEKKNPKDMYKMVLFIQGFKTSPKPYKLCVDTTCIGKV